MHPKFNPHVALYDDEGIIWDGPFVAWRFANSDGYDREGIAEVIEDLTRHGAHITGGGAAPLFRLVTLEG